MWLRIGHPYDEIIMTHRQFFLDNTGWPSLGKSIMPNDTLPHVSKNEIWGRRTGGVFHINIHLKIVYDNYRPTVGL